MATGSQIQAQLWKMLIFLIPVVDKIIVLGGKDKNGR